MIFDDWSLFYTYILQAEQAGLVKRTYRRLDPQRQRAILQAILDEAARLGPAALNIKLVARQAGVSVGSLYQYFGDRDTMVAFAVDLCVRYCVDAFEQYRPYLAEMPLRDALTAYISSGIEWSRAETWLLKLFARAAYQGDASLADKLVIPIANALRAMVQALLQAAAARGEIRPDVDLEATTRLIHALLIAYGDSQLLPYLNNYFQVLDEAVTPERSLQALLELALSGIAASGTAGAPTEAES